MPIRRFALAALLLAAGTGLSAQNLRYGGQATLSLPLGDLDDALDGKLGIGIGSHLFLDLKDGHALVPRVDYLRYQRSVGSIDTKLSTLTFGADYNYFLGRKAGEGFYALAGIGFSTGRLEVTGAGHDTEGSLALALGAGYTFTRNLGTELRYSHAKYDDLKTPALQASVFYRF